MTLCEVIHEMVAFVHMVCVKIPYGFFFAALSQSGIIIYTDGAALGNPGPGGYGAVLMYGGHRRELTGGFRLTTNNRMELLAVIRALETIKQPGIPVHVYTDSKYVCDAIEKGWLFNWKKKGWAKVKNVDLWKHFLTLHEKFKPRFHWVKGHAGIEENERCDFLATSSAQQRATNVDMGYEKSKEQEDRLL